MNGNPLDEPTTLDTHDLPRSPPTVPHRHVDTDLRPVRGFLLAAALGALVSGMLLLGYYWLIR